MLAYPEIHKRPQLGVCPLGVCPQDGCVAQSTSSKGTPLQRASGLTLHQNTRHPTVLLFPLPVANPPIPATISPPPPSLPEKTDVSKSRNRLVPAAHTQNPPHPSPLLMVFVPKCLNSNSSGGSQAWGHYPRKPRKIPRTPAEPRRDPAEPSERPRRALAETPAEPSERQISSESLAEGCAPRMVTLRNFKINRTHFRQNVYCFQIRMDSIVTGTHWTGSPNKSIDQIGENCQPKPSKNCVPAPPDNFWTILVLL